MKVLEIDNLGKQYRLGVTGSGTLSHDLNRWIAKIRGKEDPYLKLGQVNDRTANTRSGYVWALRNISFELNQGDVLGVIGRNGAGKSTLLKLLSGITLPTEGRIKYKGRMASLLEVGTGFHPELTGRENIFLNGAILGMTKSEIKLRFDEIIEFSGCSAYIDTPVKRYSSGMLVRLGFSVAAHMEPDILVVDEVLAVGDLEFQQKCLGKMGEVSKSGRTILFVSHNMQAVAKLCTKGIYLKNGEMCASGLIGDVLEEYLKSTAIDNFKYLKNGNSNSEGCVQSAAILNSVDNESGNIYCGETWKIKIAFELLNDTNHVIVAVGLSGMMDENINTTWSTPFNLTKGNYEITFTCKNQFYSSGNYFVTIGLSTFERAIEYLENVISFSIVEQSMSNLDTRIVRTKGHGVILNQMEENLIKL